MSIAVKTGNELICIGLQVRKLSIAKYFDYSEILINISLHNFTCKRNDLFIILKLNQSLIKLAHYFIENI